MPRSTVRATFAWLTLAALALRILVPAGLMPASVADGWFLQLCPDGQPPQVMAALMGDAHAHHHHDTDQATTSFSQCELGAGLSLAAAVGAMVSPTATPDVSQAIVQAPVPPAQQALRASYNPRAPPLRRLLHS